MREILYVQAGSLANYVGTHFWNTQQAYFTYDDSEEPDTVHDISFREGLTDTGVETYCPRLLVFDRKANFGTLSKDSALFGLTEEEPTDSLSLWNGDVVEYKQESITKSAYHDTMDEEVSDRPLETEDPPVQDFMPRYWSDFNRVYYIPRTIQRLPDTADWENTEGNWNLGRDSFVQHNQDSGLMEESVRLFLEECDALQGIHIMNDTATFGSFINSFLVSFRDDFLKLPALVFPLLSEAIPGQIDVDDSRSTLKIVNDALCLRGLNEVSSMNIPVQSPSTWSPAVWKTFPGLDQTAPSLYHASAVLSAHIETSTFPLRMKGSADTMADFCGQLNWRGMTRFGQLNGVFPASTPTAFDTNIHDFSATRLETGGTAFARRDVSRGFSQADVLSYEHWHTGLPLPDAYISTVHAPAYPVPSSFPSLTSSHPKTSRGGLFTPPRAASVFTSITAGSQTAGLFSLYARSVDDCAKRRLVAVLSAGLDVDELKELGNDLWTLHDNYADAEDSPEDDPMGEDEEY